MLVTKIKPFYQQNEAVVAVFWSISRTQLGIQLGFLSLDSFVTSNQQITSNKMCCVIPATKRFKSSPEGFSLDVISILNTDDMTTSMCLVLTYE